MIQGMRTLFRKRLLRQLIEMATQALYSEQFDMEFMVARMSRNQTSVASLRAYVAIQTAARLTEPLTDADVDRAFDAVQLSEAHSESPRFRDILDVHRELAEHHWSLQHLAILRGKLAHKSDEYSYEGTIYSVQYSNRGPVSMEERAKYEQVCKQMADLNRQIEDAELEAWKKQDETEYQRYKEDLEVRALGAEIEANEAESIQLESSEIVSMLEARLNALLHDGEATRPNSPHAQ